MANSTLSNTPRGDELDSRLIKGNMRTLAINVVGKLFHLFLAGGEKDLHQAAKNYLHKMNISLDVSDASRQAIDDFVKGGKGIIFLDHHDYTFADAIPCLDLLGEEAVGQTKVYTGRWNESLHRSSFPNSSFASVTMKTREDASTIKQMIADDMERVSADGGYVMVFPSGASDPADLSYKAVAHQMIKGADDSLPVLVIDTVYSGSLGYTDMLKRTVSSEDMSARVSASLLSVGNFRGKTGQEMREYTDSLLSQE